VKPGTHGGGAVQSRNTGKETGGQVHVSDCSGQLPSKFHSQQLDQRGIHGNVPQDFVSFYFTNIPGNITYNELRQGFEVCGIMEDVYLARKRNVNGGVFGFVRYGKVKDVDKLLKSFVLLIFGYQTIN